MFFILLMGCSQTQRMEQRSDLSTPEGLIDYLKDLPAVQDVQLWENPYGPGLKITTRHYEVYTTLLEPLMLRQVPSFMESAFAAYQSQLPDRADSAHRFVTYLFAQRSEWDAFTKDFTGDQAPVYLSIYKGAYALNGVCAAYHIGRSQTFAVLGHEGWHQFNSRFFTFRLPSWLDEGIATLFETCRYDRGKFVFEPQKNIYRLGSLKVTLQEGQYIPLEKLITLNPGQVLPAMGGADEAVTAFYAQTYALVRFLREEHYGIRLRNYHALLAAGLRGNWPLSDIEAQVASDRNLPMTVAWNYQVSPRLFAMYIDSDLERIEKEYRAFCGKIVYHVRVKQGP